MVKNWEPITAYAVKEECIIFPEGPFREARWEEQKNYDIAWFIWDRDGSFPKAIIPLDWEPLILFWKEEKLAMVTARPHFRWKDYPTIGNEASRFTLPLTVVFEGTHHGAKVRNKSDESFDQRLDEKYELLDYNFEAILPKDVPSYASRPTIPLSPIRMEEIHSRARKTSLKLGIR